jgi:hypothetical protein
MFSSPANRRPAMAGLFCLIFLTSLCGLASAQQFTPATVANAKQFVGVWKGDFHGTPFVTVTIGFEGDKLVGSISHANIELNEAGELTKAEAVEGANPISDAQVNGNVLRITTTSEDGSGDSFHSELRWVANNEASLRMLVPPDVPKPKPWRLERVAAKP